MTTEEEERLEASFQRALAEPVPPVLRSQLADWVGPYASNLYLRHADVMDCIDVAFPVIRDWLRAHPADLAAGGPG